MCTNGSGTNSVKPPDCSCCCSRSEQMPRPVLRLLDVPEHDRHVRAQADAVRGLVHGEPLRGRDLVGADDRAHLVVEDLRRRARQRAEAEVAQHPEVVLERQAERLRALPDLERRERMDVQIGQLAPDRVDDGCVVLAGERRMDAALEAHLGRAAVPRLAAAADDLLVRDEVRRAAQVRRQLALREGAEAAAEVADVRVLDVPGDDVADLVAADLPPQPVGRREHALPLLAAGAERAGRAPPPPARRPCPPAARRARRRTGPGRSRPGASRPRARARARRTARSAVGSTAGSTHSTGEVAGIDRQPRRELEAARAGGRREPVAVGPGRLGVDVVDRDRRDAAPVVDAGVEQARKVVVGEVRRRLHGDVGRQQQARRRDRPEVVVEARLRMRRHPRARLGAEVLHDHLLQVAVPLVQLAQGLERLDPLRPRLADPDQDPARERDPQLAGQVDRLEAAGGLLVRRGPVRAALRGEPLGDRLEHDPHRGRDRPQRDRARRGSSRPDSGAAAGRSPRGRASRRGPGTRSSSRSRAPRARPARPCSAAPACRRA